MRNYLMLVLLSLSIAHISAQDTLRKVVEYDIKMESADKINVPWLRDYVASPKDNWLSKLMLDLCLGEIKGYEEFESEQELGTKWFQQSINGAMADTVYIIDPITFEEKIEIWQHKPWNSNKMVALRIKQEWKWDDQLKKLASKTRVAVLYKVIDAQGKDRGLMPLFWVDIP